MASSFPGFACVKETTMKKIALPLCFGLAAAHANVVHAASSVDVYGLLDAALVQENGGIGKISKLTSGVSAGSRLGLRGTEDIGNGLQAVFTLEAGLLTDTGRSEIGRA